MTKEQAEATGQLTGVFRGEPEVGGCADSALADANGFHEAYVMLSPTLGVAAIGGFPGVRTPEGIGFGSTLAEVENAYGKLDREIVMGFGRINVKAPGDSRAVYRLTGLDGGKVTTLTLQFGRQDCYE